MKNKKILKITTIILVIILISLISFIGVYVKVQNRMENKVKDYKLAMDLKGARVISLKVKNGIETIVKDKDGNVVEEATDEDIQKNGYTKEEKTINPEENLSVENYKKTKNIIEKRLNKLNSEDYNIRLNEENGTIYIEIPENDKTDHTVSNISETGKFEIIDSTDKTVLIDNSMLKSASILQNATESGTVIYLSIEFNKEGKEKLKEISNTYVKAEEDDENATENNTTDENQTDENATESEETTNTESKDKQVTLQIDGSEMITTSFDEEISNGTIQLSMGAATTNKNTLNSTIESASTIAILLNEGKLPLEYEIDENKYIQSDVTEDLIIKSLICVTIIIVVALAILVIKYRILGLLSSISYIGLVAVYLLVIRYTNVSISLQGIAGILLTIILNYIFNLVLLRNIKNNTDEKISNIINSTYKEFVLKLIPVLIISVVFTLIKLIPISSFGMTLFWGVIVMIIYNITVTKKLLEIKANK